MSGAGPMPVKYRVGVMPGPWPTGPAGRDFFWRFVELCEKSEIDSLWFSERLSSPQPIPEPMTAMAAIAARTTRLKFGPSVFVTSLPRFSGWKPSTSLSGETASRTFLASTCGGSGNCTRMPSISRRWFNSSTVLRISAVVTVSGGVIFSL